MAAEGISGKDGYVKADGTKIAEITGWRFNRSANNPAWASSSTSGCKTRVKGVLDGSGSVDFKYSPTNPLDSAYSIQEGSSLYLDLYVNATKYLHVVVIIDSINDEVDINDGEVVGGSFDFSVTEIWTNNL